MTIYISNWNKNQDRVSDINLYLMESFIKNVRRYSTDITIIFMIDNITFSCLGDYIKDNCEIRLVMDQFNNHQPHEWVLVKLKAISLIEDVKFLHIDYDIVFQYDLNEVIRIFDESIYDVIYQSEELSVISYYKRFLRANRQYSNIFEGMNKRVAYNAGITYVKNRNFIDLIKRRFDFYSDEFGDYVSLEQLLIPNDLMRNNLKVGTLIDLLREFKFKNKEFGGIIDYEVYKELNAMGCFISKIGYYHFSGLTKFVTNIKNFIDKLNE